MDDARFKKLRFRAWHRGFREADLILGAFADAELAALPPHEVEQFERLLEASDHDLYAWIVGSAQPPAAHAHGVLQKIQSFSRGGPMPREGA